MRRSRRAPSTAPDLAVARMSRRRPRPRQWTRCPEWPGPIERQSRDACIHERGRHHGGENPAAIREHGLLFGNRELQKSRPHLGPENYRRQRAQAESRRGRRGNASPLAGERQHEGKQHAQLRFHRQHPNRTPLTIGRLSSRLSPPMRSAAVKNPFCPPYTLTTTAGATASNRRRSVRRSPPAATST